MRTTGQQGDDGSGRRYISRSPPTMVDLTKLAYHLKEAIDRPTYDKIPLTDATTLQVEMGHPEGATRDDRQAMCGSVRQGRASLPQVSVRSDPGPSWIGLTRQPPCAEADPPADHLPPKQRILETRAKSPELMSWDNPFPAFPRPRKKNADAGQQPLDGMMSDMRLQDGARRMPHPVGQTATDQKGPPDLEWSRAQPDQSDLTARQDQPIARHNGPADTAVPNFSSTRPYGSQDQPVPVRAGPAWQQARPKQVPSPLAVNTHQPISNQFRDGSQPAPLSAPPIPSPQNTRAVPQDFPGWNFSGHGSSEYRRAHPDHIERSTNATPNSSYGRTPGQNPQIPRPSTAYSERSATAPPASSASADPKRHPVGVEPLLAFQPPEGHHQRNQSVGDFYDSYYEADSQYHGPPSRERQGSRSNNYQQLRDEEMPNFDAMPSHPTNHPPGTSIESHLPPKSPTNDAACHPIPEVPAVWNRFRSDRSPSPTVAAQAHRSRSQPNLRDRQSADAGSPGSSGRGQRFEMAGDVPEMPPVPPHYHPTHIQPYRSPEQMGGQHRYTPSPYSTQGRQPPRPLPANNTYSQFTFPNQDPSQGRVGYPHRERSQGSASLSETPRPSIDSERRRTPPSTQRPYNPDALPAHPTPVRFGLTSQTTTGQPRKPPPIRRYDNDDNSDHAPPVMHTVVSSSKASPEDRRRSTPVTHPELDRLHQAVKTRPGDQATQLLLAKKLAEAAVVLADNGGRADSKTRNKNRDRYCLDALKIVKKLTAAGYSDAVFYLADCYGTGRLGLEVDPKEAFSLYQSAAKAGHAQSAYRAAVCCEMGVEGGGGTRKDPLKAIQWYQKAASYGDTPAMYKMGMILLNGLLGQPKNPNEAVAWLKRAADRANEENPHALHELVR